MALKVGELYAELGVDDSKLAKGVDAGVTSGAKSLMRLEKVGKEAGDAAAAALAGAQADFAKAGDLLGKAGGKGIGSNIAKGVADGEQAAGAAGRRVGERAGKEAGDGLGAKTAEGGKAAGEGMMDAVGMGGMGSAAGVGAAIGALVIGALAGALDREESIGRLRANLRLTADETERFGRIAESAFRDNYGASLDEVVRVQALVMQQIPGMRNAADSDIGAMTRGVLNLADAFESDTQMAVQAVSTMLRTGLAKDGQEALDIIATGMQNGANKADDLLQTLQEYSTQFRALGINGRQALGLLSQGVNAGARDADTVADTLKEFAIRVREPMKTAAGDIGSSAKSIRSSQESILESHKNVARAERALGDTRIQIADQAKTAARSVADAEKGLSTTQERSRQVQVDLMQARKDAEEQLKGLAASLEDAQLAQRASDLSLERARQNLADVQNDPQATDLARREAQLAVDQAIRGAKAQTDRVAELQATKAEADAAGVEGSKAVLDATKNVTAAQADMEAAEQRVQDAREAQFKSALSGNRQLESAFEAILQAQRSVRKAEEGMQEARSAGAKAIGGQLTPIGQAYKDLGLDGEQIQRMIAEGGDAAAYALAVTMAKLREIEDPIQRSQLAVTLFGTKAEDMAEAINAMDLSTAEESLGGVTGAAGDLDSALTTNADTVATWKRDFMSNLADSGDSAILWVSDTGAAFTQFKNGLGMIWTWIGDKTAALTGGVRLMWDMTIAWFQGIPGRVGAVLGPMWDSVTSGVSGAYNWVVGTFDAMVATVGGLPGRVGGMLGGLWDGLKGGMLGAVNWCIDQLNKLIRGANSISSKIPLVGGAFKVPELDRVKFHSGGKVRGTQGSEVDATLLAGERVLTEAQDRQMQRALAGMGGGGFGEAPTITVPVVVHVTGPMLGTGLERIVIDAVNRGADKGMRIASGAVR